MAIMPLKFFFEIVHCFVLFFLRYSGVRLGAFTLPVSCWDAEQRESHTTAGQRGVCTYVQTCVQAPRTILQSSDTVHMGSTHTLPHRQQPPRDREPRTSKNDATDRVVSRNVGNPSPSTTCEMHLLESLISRLYPCTLRGSASPKPSV